MAMSNTLANGLLNAYLRNTSYTVTTVYVSLHTAPPGTTGASEVTGGSYARQAVAFNAASAKSSTNSGAANFTGMPLTTVTDVGLWDAATGGNFLMGGQLQTPKTTNSGDTFTLPVTSGITVSLS